MTPSRDSQDDLAQPLNFDFSVLHFSVRSFPVSLASSTAVTTKPSFAKQFPTDHCLSAPFRLHHLMPRVARAVLRESLMNRSSGVH